METTVTSYMGRWRGMDNC